MYLTDWGCFFVDVLSSGVFRREVPQPEEEAEATAEQVVEEEVWEDVEQWTAESEGDEWEEGDEEDDGDDVPFSSRTPPEPTPF